MSDEPRQPTREEVIRDRPRSPQSLQAEGGPQVIATESEHRSRGGTVEEQPEHGVHLRDAVGMQSLGGEDMGADDRVDGDELREEDVSEEDRLSDDVRESAAGLSPYPGGAQGEDMEMSQRIDGQDGEDADE